MGSNPEEWEELYDVINGTEADMCKLNISCPFAVDTGFKMDAGAIAITTKLVNIVKKKLSIPLSVKITPQTPNLMDVAKRVELAGADALTVQGRLSGIMIEY